MNLKTKRVLATVGGGAAILAGVVTATAVPTVSGVTAEPGSDTAGSTVTQSTEETRAPAEVAVPSITGPAPLPTEEQGLPG